MFLLKIMLLSPSGVQQAVCPIEYFINFKCDFYFCLSIKFLELITDDGTFFKKKKNIKINKIKKVKLIKINS
jgi:hypothetical protein